MTEKYTIEIEREQIENADVDDLMLSEQQKKLWELYADMSYTEVADEMDLAPNTIKTYLDLIYEKRQKAELTLVWLDMVKSGELDIELPEEG